MPASHGRNPRRRDMRASRSRMLQLERPEPAPGAPRRLHAPARCHEAVEVGVVEDVLIGREQGDAPATYLKT